MFDVFQNVLFGKKKTSGESSKDKSSDSEEYVVVGQTSNTVRETTSSQSETAVSRNPYTAHFVNSGDPLSPYNLLQSNKSEEKYSSIMPLQDVPFTINFTLQSSVKLDQIWQTVAPCIDFINSFHNLQEDYDFVLEKSVISETTDQ